jgi:hypothetical protein
LVQSHARRYTDPDHDFTRAFSAAITQLASFDPELIAIVGLLLRVSSVRLGSRLQFLLSGKVWLY